MANNPLRFTDPTGLDAKDDYFNAVSRGEIKFESLYSPDPFASVASSLPAIPNFQAPNAWDQYQNFWSNVSNSVYKDPEVVNALLRIMWMGVDKWGTGAMPGYGWGMNLGAPGLHNFHTDIASKNMVKAVQASLGVTVDGKYGDETKQALQMLGFKGTIVGQRVLSNLLIDLVQVDANYINAPEGGGGPLMLKRYLNNFYKAVDEIESSKDYPGIGLVFSDMFRTNAKQDHFKYITANGITAGKKYHGLYNVVANVSPHQFGGAFDVGNFETFGEKEQDFIINTFAKYGFNWYGPDDPVHFTAAGLNRAPQQLNYIQSIWTDKWESIYGAYNCPCTRH